MLQALLDVVAILIRVFFKVLLAPSTPWLELILLVETLALFAMAVLMSIATQELLSQFEWHEAQCRLKYDSQAAMAQIGQSSLSAMRQAVRLQETQRAAVVAAAAADSMQSSAAHPISPAGQVYYANDAHTILDMAARGSVDNG